jgi:hypothetical protein
MARPFFAGVQLLVSRSHPLHIVTSMERKNARRRRQRVAVARVGVAGVPQAELARFARTLFDLGYGVDPEDVAERFGVSRARAARALVELVATRDIPA